MEGGMMGGREGVQEAQRRVANKLGTKGPVRCSSLVAWDP